VAVHPLILLDYSSVDSFIEEGHRITFPVISDIYLYRIANFFMLSDIQHYRLSLELAFIKVEKTLNETPIKGIPPFIGVARVSSLVNISALLIPPRQLNLSIMYGTSANHPH